MPGGQDRREEGESLRNDGVLVQKRGRPAGEARTVVVVGVPRGGTTMVAGALHCIGVFMGDSIGNTYEDRPLSEAVEAEDWERVSKIARRRDWSYDVWGWKRPSSFKYLDAVDSTLRNPHYVVVFRDMLSIAKRRKMSMGFDVNQTLHGTIGAYRRIATFIGETSRPTMMVSYEKCLTNKEVFLGALVEFVGCDPSISLSQAREFIQPDREDYLLGSRLDAPE